jgi:putative phage-type endonuclease
MFGASDGSSDADNNKSDESIEEETYIYPASEKFNCAKETYQKHGPFGTQWLHDIQVDDKLDSKMEKRIPIVEQLLTLEFDPQGSEGWHKLRNERATASDAGCILDINDHEAPYKFLIKKVINPPFENNMFCYHGKKFEHIATMIYQYRMNVTVEEFGLIAHPKYYFLAASPDGIVGKYKLDGKSRTKYVGRMLEIKCPLKRKINTTGETYGDICPKYYWAQVQLQLECCNLDECDFWQCDIREYEDKEEFIRDTDLNEPFRSKTTGMEKGCLIQLIPKNKDITDKKYFDVIYESAKFIYPPKVEMSPQECDIWIAETMIKFRSLCPKDYCFDKVIYWKMTKTHCILIKRDREWFSESLPKIERMWKYVEYLRKNKEKSDLFFDYIEYSYPKNNKKIMQLAEYLCDEPDHDDSKKIKEYSKKIIQLKEEIEYKKKKEEIEKLENIDDDD